MIRFLAAALELRHTPLDSAFRITEQPRYDAGSPNMKIGMGWHIRSPSGADSGRVVTWHNGGTGGYRSWIGLDRNRGIAAVVLTNGFENIDDIGFHLVDPSIPLATVRRAVTLPSDALAEYVGRYPLTPNFVIEISQYEKGLMLQATGQPMFPIWASGKDEFFLRVVDAQIHFTRSADRRVDGLVLHQNGQNLRGAKSAP
jgi:hypothetical protein